MPQRAVPAAQARRGQDRGMDVGARAHYRVP